MRNNFNRIVIALLVIGTVANAQQTSIIGKVVDSSGAVLPSAAVVAQSAGGTTYKTVTDKGGTFQFPTLTATDYSVRADAPGFAPTIEKLSLLVGQTLNLDIRLLPEGTTSTVTVTNNSTQIDTVTSEVAGNIDPETMAKIPLNGRNYMDLAELIPGIRRNAITNYSPLGSLNGGHEQFNLDSQQVTQNGADSSFGQPQFSRDAIAQFQIITNQFDATQGRTSQLALNVQSKTGANALHGTAFGYFRNDFFDASDPITKTVLPFSDQQYGGTFGGPILRDKLWYFGSYEGEHRPQTTNTTLIAFGTPAPSYSYTNTLKNNEYLARGDYQPTVKDHIFGRYFYFHTAQPDLLPSGSSSISRQYGSTLHNYGYIGSWNRALTSNLVNNFFGSWFYTAGLNTPLVPSMQLTFPTQVIGAAYNYPSNLPVSVFQFRDDIFWLKGKHSIKAGGELLYELNDGQFPQNVRGTVAFSVDPPLGFAATFPNQLDPSTWNYASISPYVTTYTQGFGNFNTNIKRKILGAWIQDDWKLLPRLTANVGVRYDNDIGIFTPGSNTVNGVVGPSHGNNVNFSPRVGFAYDITGKGKTVLRGGLGIYYADIIANQTIDAQLFNGVNTVQAAAPITAGFSLTNPFAGQDTSQFISNPQNLYQAIQVNGPNLGTPWAAQGSIGVQQEFMYGLTGSIDYTHLRNHHEWTRQDANIAYDPNTGWNQTNYGTVSSACPNGCITSRVQPNSHYSTIATFYTPTYVSSLISNVLISIRERTRHGVTGSASYTYGTQKDNSASPFSYPSNPYNYKSEWANSVDDQRHTLSVNADYQWRWGIHGGLLYHYGSGLAYGPSIGTAAPTALTLQTNRSVCLEPTGYVAYSTLPGSICSRVSRGAPATGATKAIAAAYTVKLYNNPAADHFDPTTGLTTVDRNSFRGIPIERIDANLAKSTTFHERYKVTTTVEAFNLFNHSNYGSYNTVATSASYGLPTTTSGVLAFFARQLQFSARLDFCRSSLAIITHPARQKGCNPFMPTISRPPNAFLSSLLLLCTPLLAAQMPKVDWTKTNPETLANFTSLIRIDSSNPPGNETLVANYLKAVLDQEGIPSILSGSESGRMSLIARLKGNGSKKPLLIMGHTDVVGVQRDHWTEDPFGAKLVDGYIWGRGTIDDKDLVVGGLMTMILLKRSGATLDRDIIFVAEAGEEGGSPKRTFGISYLIDHNYPDIDAEYCLTEGGAFSSTSNKVLYQLVQVSEKEGRGMKLVAHGISGHGSMPREDNAIVHLATAVGRIGAWQPPMELTPITKLYIEGLEKVSPPEEAARYKDLFDPARTAAAQDYFRKNNIRINSTIRTSISPNIIEGGFRANVIPSEATATLDIRAVPGEDIDKIKDMMDKVIADPAVQIITPPSYPKETPSSSIDTEMYRDLTSVQEVMFPGTPTIPGMSTGGTDMKGLRAKGMQCYGIGAELPTEDLITHAMHSDNERIKESALYSFVQYEYAVVAKISLH